MSSISSTARTSPGHIEAFQPTFCKVLVRYNPEGNQALNRRQTDRLKRLSDYLHSESRSLFMFELLVPAEKAQLEKVKGDKKTYDLEIRPRLMVQTIEELQDARRRTRRLEDRRSRLAGGLRDASWRPLATEAGTKSAASFWAAARTTRRCANG